MSLISKYNIPVPRYTSYPTVPFWDKTPTEDEWLSLVKQTFKASNKTEGISLYLHLPSIGINLLLNFYFCFTYLSY